METAFATTVLPVIEQDQIIETEINHGFAIIAISVLTKCDAVINKMKACKERVTKK